MQTKTFTLEISDTGENGEDAERGAGTGEGAGQARKTHGTAPILALFIVHRKSSD